MQENVNSKPDLGAVIINETNSIHDESLKEWIITEKTKVNIKEGGM